MSEEQNIIRTFDDTIKDLLNLTNIAKEGSKGKENAFGIAVYYSHIYQFLEQQKKEIEDLKSEKRRLIYENQELKIDLLDC